jgi:hypothetical protein
MKLEKTKGKKTRHIISACLGILDNMVKLFSLGNYTTNLQINYVMYIFEKNIKW